MAPLPTQNRRAEPSPTYAGQPPFPAFPSFQYNLLATPLGASNIRVGENSRASTDVRHVECGGWFYWARSPFLCSTLLIGGSVRAAGTALLGRLCGRFHDELLLDFAAREQAGRTYSRGLSSNGSAPCGVGRRCSFVELFASSILELLKGQKVRKDAATLYLGHSLNFGGRSRLRKASGDAIAVRIMARFWRCGLRRAIFRGLDPVALRAIAGLEFDFENGCASLHSSGALSEGVSDPQRGAACCLSTM